MALIEAVAPQMIERKCRAASSTSARSPPSPAIPTSGTARPRPALLNITKSYAGYLGKDGILVNAVAPGPTLTDMYEQLPQSRTARVEAHRCIPGAPASAEEVAAAIVWLRTDSPPILNGATIDVNDGTYPR